MPKQRLSTTVDHELLTQARNLHAGGTDASLVERALKALLAEHRRAQVAAAYAEAYRAHPLQEPDDWGDLASFGEAVSAR